MEYRMTRQDELYHYGVKGMKWGVRHDYDPKGRVARGKAVVVKNRRKKMSKDTKRRIAKGALIATGIIAGSVILYKTGTFDKLASIGKDFSKGIVNDIKSDIPIGTISDKAQAIADRIKPINRLCNFNSFASSLDISGIRISLKSNAGDHYVNNVSSFLTKALKNTEGRLFDSPAIGSKFSDKKVLDDFIMRKVAKGMEGAHGQIGSDLVRGGGHVLNWKVDDGIVKYYDTHARGHDNVYRAIDDASHYFNGQYLNGAKGVISRLDGLTKEDLNLDFLNEIFDIDFD